MTPDTDSIPVDEELESQFTKIAEQLSTLAALDEVPLGFSVTYDPFDPEEVAFDSGSWLLRVRQVQGWLNLEEDIDPSAEDSSAEIAAFALFKALGMDTPEACFDVVNGSVRPTLTGTDALTAQLDSAVALQARYSELRESLTRRQTTDRWIELWDAEHQFDEAAAEPIKARTAIWPIQEFSGKARQRKLNLSPSYQRGDVWPTGHSQKLIESVLRGIPLPSIILLRPEADGAAGIYEVVDGKQRLTAILRFVGQHPDAIRRVEKQDMLVADVNFLELFTEDYKKFRRLWKVHFSESLTATKEAEYYFPFKLASSKQAPAFQGPLETLAGKYYYEIRDEVVNIGSTEESVRDVFESVSDYKLPLIEYLEATPRQIHEVFHLYNRQGKHLTAEEIRNALFHEVDLMRLLLVASGDNADVDLLAPYIPKEVRWKLADMGETLTNYRFGTARYKRTKLLSWLTSLVLHPALQDDGTLTIRSTAKQIDEMLLSVRDRLNHPLADPNRLSDLVSDLHECLDAHASCGGWADEFMDDGDGRKWQELQLVASLVGVFLLSVMSDSVPELLEERHDDLLDFTSRHLRPVKTQNKTQWGFIGKVSLGIVEVMGIEFHELEDALVDRYGVSCLPTLEAAALHYEPRPQPRPLDSE